MKYFTTILTILGLYLFVYACSEKPCTDDGCPDFNKDGDDSIVIPTPTDDIRGKLDIEEWLENPAFQVETVSYQPINLEYGIHKVVNKTHILPDIDTSSKDVFVQSLNSCINYLYQSIKPEHQIPNELIIAQAVIETGWGKSRFANEGNNLFGIRTFNEDEEWLLPITWDQTKWIGWGVKVYETKCDSVRDYVRIINEVWAYESLREARDNGADAYELADHLTKYASKPTYTKLVKQLIKYNIEGVYDI